MNSGVRGEFGSVKNNSQKELLNLIRNAKILDEIPLIDKNNFLLTWDVDNQT